MEAMERRQMSASAEANEIVQLVNKLPVSYNGLKGDQWAAILPNLVPDVNIELKRKAARVGWVRHQFTANRHVLEDQCGIIVEAVWGANRNRTNVYKFTKLAGAAETALEKLTKTLHEDFSLWHWQNHYAIVRRG